MVSTRRRFGVAVLIEPPLSVEVDGLRKALGDPSLARIPAHLTLVPPVNVRLERVPEALAVLRAAAGRSSPFRLTLGPVGSFAPLNPVLFLTVGGDLDALRRLRDGVFRDPLQRPLTWPWVPHVTVADSFPEERIAGAVAALDSFEALQLVDRVVLLEEGIKRRWDPVADVVLGPPSVVGRGSLELELTESRILDPQARGLVAGTCDPDEARGRAGEDELRVVVTGRREGRPVGVAMAWKYQGWRYLTVLVEPRFRRQGIGSHLLAAVCAALARDGWVGERPCAVGPEEFYRARSDLPVIGRPDLIRSARRDGTPSAGERPLTEGDR